MPTTEGLVDQSRGFKHLTYRDSSSTISTTARPTSVKRIQGTRTEIDILSTAIELALADDLDLVHLHMIVAGYLNKLQEEGRDASDLPPSYNKWYVRHKKVIDQKIKRIQKNKLRRLNRKTRPTPGTQLVS